MPPRISIPRRAGTALLALSALLVMLPRAGAAVTDDDVWRAISRGREWLINQRQPDGSFGGGSDGYHAGKSALAFMTLAYMGEHPNRTVMSTGLDYLMKLNATKDFTPRQGYALPIRVMGLSYIYGRLGEDHKARLKSMMSSDILNYILPGQNTDKDSGGGGWRYKLDKTDYDFSVTQWPLLAMREASYIGVEFPQEPLRKARTLYFKEQNEDGGWGYQNHDRSTGSMTAAGLASLYIIADILEPASGCPCLDGASQGASTETWKRIDRALEWLGRNFTAASNPHAPNAYATYWLYCVERVGIAAGYKYFGSHNWYNEGADNLVKTQLTNGSWGSIEDTCFAMLFLYKGRAPVLFNKCKFDGQWNPHRRDLANLVRHIEQEKEQQFHWQIVDLKSPLEELHDAPVLFISAESPPKFTAAEKLRLRQFTDTGGTVLMEAVCGNVSVRAALRSLCAEVWPEWKLLPLSASHPLWDMNYKMQDRPELFGIDDGVRTSVLLAPDDISCAWQTRAVAVRKYMFEFGTNLYAYATDGAPLRAKLARREAPKTDRYTKAVAVAAPHPVKVARVVYAGRWEAGANYGGLRKLAEVVRLRAKANLVVTEPTAIPYTTGGVDPAGLGGFDVAYLAGSGSVGPTAAERDALAAFIKGGGFLWIEAAAGSNAFDVTVRKLADDMGLKLVQLPATHPLMTGDMPGGQGYDLRKGVEFTPAVRIPRLSVPFAEFWGLYKGDLLVGLYSPLDVTFALTGLEAGHSGGYKAEDAAAVATNIAVFLSIRKPAPEPRA